ncbi:MAG: CPCC family cysteine-rich protein [Gaiella sp.]
MSWPERTHTVPDGRELRATYDGESVGWVVHLVGQEDRPVAARDIHDALVELLEPGEGGWPSWFMEAAEDLAARDTPLGRRYPCPCCGYLTLEEAPTGTYEICGVCFWEDDGVQFHNLDYEGGANRVSLNQARRSFREHGVSETRFKSDVRPPLPDEWP